MSTPEISELLPAEHLRPGATRAFRRIVVPAAMALTMIVASIGVSTWAYHAHRAEALRRADELIASVEERIGTQVRGYLEPVAALTELARDVLGADALADERRSLTGTFAFSVLSDYPQVAITSFADVNGNFLMYLRNADGGIDTKRIERAAGGVTTTWVRRDAHGRVVSRQQVPDDGYDPRTRPWYQGAIGRDAPSWSDVYVFFTSREPGVTVSLPIGGADAGLSAVYGMDITLDSLGEFLAGLDVGRTGVALIVDDTGRLVAYPDASRMLVDSGSGLRTATVSELDAPALLRAWNRFRVEGAGRRVVTVGEARYLSAVASLQGIVGQPWSIMIVVPERDFTDVVAGNYRVELLLNIGVLTLAAALAVLVVRQALRADRLQRRAAARETEVHRRAHAFSALVADPGLHDRDDAQALERATRTVADALGAERVSVWRWHDAPRRLVCEDCFDRRSGGHTDGAELRVSDLPVAAAMLDEPLAMTELRAAPADSRSPSYFARVGVDRVLSAPVGDGAGVVWAEDTARADARAGQGTDADWIEHALPFLTGVANLLRTRIASVVAPPRVAPRPPAEALVRAGASAHAVPSASLDAGEVDDERLRRLRRASGAGDAADVRERVTVMTLLLDDVQVWSRPAAGDGGSSRAGALFADVEAAAAAHGVPYVKVLGERVVCAAGVDGEPSDGARAIAALALEAEDRCVEVAGALEHRPAFRIGIDTGPALVCAVGGGGGGAYNLIGDAVSGADAMARSAEPGSIQVSASGHALLHERYLLAHRGLYYVHGLGERSSYLLMGPM